MASAIVSALHVLALALGLPAVYLRGRALKGRLDREAMRKRFAADTVWGIAAALWVVTGVLRAFAGLEKGSQFYLARPRPLPRESRGDGARRAHRLRGQLHGPRLRDQITRPSSTSSRAIHRGTMRTTREVP